MVVATKGGHYDFSNPSVSRVTAADVRRDLEDSLRTLGRDTIDLYYLHRVTPEVPVEGVAEGMGPLISEGLIRGWGLSQVPVEIIARHRKQVELKDSVQPDVTQYNELILKTLRSRPCTAEDLVSTLGIPADRIEPHLRRMERAGLVISEPGTRGTFYRPA